MLEQLTAAWGRAKTLANSGLARVILVGGLVIAAAEEIAAAIPAETADTPTAVALQAIAVATVIWRVVRAATTVPQPMRGLDPAPVGSATWVGPDGGQYTYSAPGVTSTATPATSWTQPGD